MLLTRAAGIVVCVAAIIIILVKAMVQIPHSLLDALRALRKPAQHTA